MHVMYTKPVYSNKTDYAFPSRDFMCITFFYSFLRIVPLCSAFQHMNHRYFITILHGLVRICLLNILSTKRMGSAYPSGGRDSVVGIATRYGLDGTGFEAQQGRGFLDASTPPPRPASLLLLGVFPGGKAARAWRSHTQRRGRICVDLYLCLASVPAWRVVGQTSFTLTRLSGCSMISERELLCWKVPRIRPLVLLIRAELRL